jgi:hypothetical protein
MSRHPSTVHLAEYAEGALSRRRTARISSHLDSGCTQCNGQVVQLQQVTSMLTSASVTFGPVPDQISTRIEMAISSESSARVTSAPVSGETSRRDLPARGQQAGGRQQRQGRRFPIFSSPLAGSLAAVGAAVVIAGGGYVIASNVSSGPPAASSAASASHPPTGAAPPVQGAAASGSASGTSPASVRFGPEVRFKHAGHQNLIDSVQTDTNYVAASLVAKARAVLAATRQSNMANSNKELRSPYAATASPPAISASQLRGCVARLAAGKDVLLVDAAKYDGKFAVIILVGTPPNGPGIVYAAGQACSATNSDILAKQDFPRS